jgi:hypothetical protein
VQQEEEGMVNGHVPEIARIKLHRHVTAPHKQWANLYISKIVWNDGIPSREMLPPVQIPL